MEKQSNTGWALDIASRNKTHYYKNGVSLCGKAIEKPYMKHFDIERNGSKYFHDCTLCIKELSLTSKKN